MPPAEIRTGEGPAICPATSRRAAACAPRVEPMVACALASALRRTGLCVPQARLHIRSTLW